MKKIENLMHSPPNTNGADYLEVILEASNNVKDVHSPLIIVIGSGLSDSGILDFTSGNLLARNPEKVTEQLISSGKIKEDHLKGITVLLSGFGQTVAPQQALGNTERDDLIDIYTKVLSVWALRSNSWFQQRSPCIRIIM
ncbi:MAG: hypothetical protein LBP35_06610 [Candidatus Ancillula trichonymphae]|jgi:hypothetical protein|nr:hypothetical protein [Candidatus Ancillula trichonymphae]